MDDMETRPRAARPEDLGRMFLDRANAGDVEGIVALYEPDAVLLRPGGEALVGIDAIRSFYQALLAPRPAFTGRPQLPLIRGDLALTSARFTSSTGPTATAEVARRQNDGSWLWVIDNPNLLAETPA